MILLELRERKSRPASMSRRQRKADSAAPHIKITIRTHVGPAEEMTGAMSFESFDFVCSEGIELVREVRQVGSEVV